MRPYNIWNLKNLASVQIYDAAWACLSCHDVTYTCMSYVLTFICKKKFNKLCWKISQKQSSRLYHFLTHVLDIWDNFSPFPSLQIKYKNVNQATDGITHELITKTLKLITVGSGATQNWKSGTMGEGKV